MTDSIRVPLGDLRALAEKATPGPWAAPLDCAPEDRTVIRGTDIHATRDDGPHWPGFFLGAVESKADAAYIAAASPDVTIALLDALDAATARALAAEEALATLRARVVAERDRLPRARLDPGEVSHVREDTGALLTEVQRGSLRGQGAAFGWFLREMDAAANRTASGDEG